MFRFEQQHACLRTSRKPEDNPGSRDPEWLQTLQLVYDKREDSMFVTAQKSVVAAPALEEAFLG